MSNVLVYSGPGVSASSLSHTLRTLRRLLPSYDVQCVNAQSLALDPWMESTSLLVLPGGRDLPYVEKLGEAHFCPISSSHPARSVGSSRMARADARIREYVVDHGGAFLGICAGAYYASQRCDFERNDPVMNVVGERPALRFYPGTCSGTVYPGFVYESDDGARLVGLQTEESLDSKPWSTYYNGGGAFIDADHFIGDGVEILARYMTEEDAGRRGAASSDVIHQIRDGYADQAAAVLCRLGHGAALLYGTHPEFPCAANSRPTRLTSAPEALQAATAPFEELEEVRFIIFGKHLQKLGLRVDLPQRREECIKLTPLLLSSRNQASLDEVAKALQSIDGKGKDLALLQQRAVPGRVSTIVDNNDTMHFYDAGAADVLFEACAQADYSVFVSPVASPNNGDAVRAGNAAEPEQEVDLHRVPKYIIFAGDGSNLRHHTPHWDSVSYYEHIESSRNRIVAFCDEESWAKPSKADAMSSDAIVQTIGDLTTYTQVVTSTQTMLDKNFKILTRLPSGLTSFATHQVSGRGRGKNAWISPLGCLQFSTLLRIPQPQQMLWYAGMSGIVFVQYLAGLAIVESVRSGALGHEYANMIGSKIRIKWPNDVYAEIEDVTSGHANQPDTSRKGTFVFRGKRYAKMAGVLVNSQFAGTELALVVGCGINTLNPRPTTSLSDLIEAHNVAGQSPTKLPPVSQERFAGAILATFERMWSTFVQAGGNFAPFVDAYRRAWLHSDQETLLTDTEPPTRARIVGITTDHGLLRCVPLPKDGNEGPAIAGLPGTYSPGAWGTTSKPNRSMPSAPTFIDLQPDGNSFDMLQNLIRRKE